MASREYMFCPRCGAVTPKDQECVNCGYDIWEDDTEYEEDDYDQMYSDTTSANDISEDNSNTNNSSNVELNASADLGSVSHGPSNVNDIQANPGNKKNEVKPKKKKTGLIVFLIIFGVLTVIGFLAIIISIVGFAFVSAVGALSNSPMATPVPYASHSPSGTYSGFAANDGGREKFSDFDYQVYYDVATLYSDEVSNANNDSFLTNYSNNFVGHTMVDRSTKTGPYMDEFYESFDDSYGYSYERRVVSYYDTINKINTSADIAYYKLVGDNIPNIDEINEELYYQQLYDFLSYIKGDKSYGEMSDISFKIDSYIMYNDDKRISILSDINVLIDSNYQKLFYIYGINVDLQNGVIMDNSAIATYDLPFVSFFRVRSDDQNGYSDTLDAMTDNEVLNFLSDPDSNVIFYTPCGLEIGFCYKYSTGFGWITISSSLSEGYDKYDFKNPVAFEIKPDVINSKNDLTRIKNSFEPYDFTVKGGKTGDDEDSSDSSDLSEPGDSFNPDNSFNPNDDITDEQNPSQNQDDPADLFDDDDGMIYYDF